MCRLKPWASAATAGRRRGSFRRRPRLNIAATAWQVRANLRASLIDYAAAQQREMLLQNQSSGQAKVVQSLQERLKAGAASSSELALVQIAFSKIQLDLSDARRLSADARVRVADAIGVSARALAGLDLTYDLEAPHPSAARLMSAEARGEALRSRVDVLGALADYAAAQSALQLEIAKQYPDIRIGPGYQFNNGDHQFTVSLAADLPVFNHNQGPVAEAEARRAEAAARFMAAQAKAISEIDRAVEAYRVTQENLAVLESLSAEQKKQNEAVQAQAQAGAADQLEIENADVEVGASELVQLDGRVKAQQAFGALEDALQRPIETLNFNAIETQHFQAMKENKP